MKRIALLILLAACGRDARRDDQQNPITDETYAVQKRGPDCGHVAVFIGEAGVWLATGTNNNARCYAPRKAGKLDDAWLVTQLVATKTTSCSPAVDVAAAPTISFAEMKDAAFSVVLRAHLPEVDLVPVADLPVPLASADTASASRSCPAGTIVMQETARPSGSAPSTTDPSAAPVVVITPDEILVNAKRVVTIADAKAGTGALAPLREALPPPAAGQLRFEADDRTSADVIDRVLKTAKSAGYDNVLWF